MHVILARSHLARRLGHRIWVFPCRIGGDSRLDRARAHQHPLALHSWAKRELTPFVWLAIAVVLAAGAVLTGRRPKGAKPVAGTRLMKSARFVLIIALLLCGGVALLGAMRH